MPTTTLQSSKSTEVPQIIVNNFTIQQMHVLRTIENILKMVHYTLQSNTCLDNAHHHFTIQQMH